MRPTRALIPAALSLLLPVLAQAHCQVPCGIYDDAARVQAMYEDAATIEKAMTQIRSNSGKGDPQSTNQVARWVHAKEDHASHVITTVAEYFLTQRVKPLAPGANRRLKNEHAAQLSELHAVMVAAMKCKQSVDLTNVRRLREALEPLASRYGGPKPASAQSKPARRR
ncbi:MAG: superoxide dismutase [Ni] [Acidobacteriota bacterium]